MKIPFFSLRRKQHTISSIPTPAPFSRHAKSRDLSHAVATGDNFIVGVQSNGCVLFAGEDEYGLRNISGWRDIVAVSAAGGYSAPAHIVGLKQNKTVVAVGDNSLGQCDVSSWKDVVAVSAGELYTLGLQANGTVLATGNVFDEEEILLWTNIVSVIAGNMCATALQEGGAIKITSGGLSQLLYQNRNIDLFSKTNITDISMAPMHIVGLCTDGTVIATGDNSCCQCNVSGWEDIVAIATGAYHTVGLRADGTVIATGSNKYGQCNVYAWSDIVAIVAGIFHTIGIRSNGSVVTAGANFDGESEVSRWKLF